MAHTPTVLNGHLDPTFAMLTSHITTRYVPETNMPFISPIFQLVHVQISDNYVSTYISYQITTIRSVTINTAMHIFHIIGICQ